MSIIYRPVWVWLGAMAALVGLWLVFWAPDSVWPGLRYVMGSALVASGATLVALQVSLRPRGRLEEKIAPAEFGAWMSLACVGAILCYLLLNSGALTGTWTGVDARQLGIKISLVAALWIVVSTLMRSRHDGAVLEDERDREIKHLAAGWGRGALIFCIFSLVVTLGLSPSGKLQWATPPVIASQLLFALLAGWLFEYAATVIYYWRNRR